MIAHFAALPDPRIYRTKKHRLTDILVIALCGAGTFEEIEAFAECREAWLKKFLELPNGLKHVAEACAADFEGTAVDHHETFETGHGRRERRFVTVIETPAGLPALWPSVVAVVQVIREREVGGTNTGTTSYYVTSLKGSAEELGRLIRRHWAIENELHWVLDVSFGEDASRTQNRNATANLGIGRRSAVALLNQDKGKGTKRIKDIKAGHDPAYPEKLLRGNKAV